MKVQDKPKFLFMCLLFMLHNLDHLKKFTKPLKQMMYFSWGVLHGFYFYLHQGYVY